jgi:hypothetical protein
MADDIAGFGVIAAQLYAGRLVLPLPCGMLETCRSLVDCSPPAVQPLLRACLHEDPARRPGELAAVIAEEAATTEVAAAAKRSSREPRQKQQQQQQHHLKASQAQSPIRNLSPLRLSVLLPVAGSPR